MIDQFLRDGTNHRTDAYGGAVEHRIRLLVEATRAIISAVGADRTAVRLAPNDDPQACADSNSVDVFSAAASALDALDIAFLEMRAPRGATAKRDLVPAIRARFRGPLVLNQAYGLADANETIASGRADAIAYGKPFIANPDLPARLARGVDLAVPDVATFYTQGEAGYTDYPAL